MRFYSARTLFVVGCILLTGLSAGCAVPQPRGEGLYKRVKEPRTGAIYHLYLPVDYVKNNGEHPLAPQFRKWPLVVTFHGMKPYDNAQPQEREWEKEADTYGYVVCAPELRTSSSFMEYPLTKEWDYVRTDRANVIAIMDHVFATTSADPQKVLSTSWSCGGYLAHYFPNRFPHRFSCIATRLSNFSSDLLTEETVSEYRDTTSIGVFIGDGDLPACKTESEEAVAWYKARGFKVVEGKMIDRMGHRRIPQTAAAFFARQLGLKPLHPEDAAKSVRSVQMTAYEPPPQLIAKMSPRGGTDSAGETRVASAEATNNNEFVRRPATNSRRRSVGSSSMTREPARNNTPQPRRRTTPRRTTTPSAAESTRIASAAQPTTNSGNWLEPVRRTTPTIADREAASRTTPAVASREPVRAEPPPEPVRQAPTYRPSPPDTRKYDDLLANRLASAGGSRDSTSGSTASRSTARPAPTRSSPPPRTTPPPPSRAQNVEISVRGPSIGTAPYYLAYGVDLPADIVTGSDFLWKDNGVWMGDEPYGVKILETPGVHRITVLMITRDNVEYRGMTTVRVLDRAASADLSGRRD